MTMQPHIQDLYKQHQAEAGPPKEWAKYHDTGICQKICKAPVVGLSLDGSVEWFAKVRGKSGRKALRRFLRTGAGPMRKLRSKKRSGKLR